MKTQKSVLKPTQNPRSEAGFTLTELISVIVILLLFGCILTSSWARTGGTSGAAQCLSNLRRLATAWTMYADDNSGRLAPNHDGATTGLMPGSECWVAGWLDAAAVTSDNTNMAMLVDQQRYPFGAYFGPYLQMDYRVFKCPADQSLDVGSRMPRVRSYSMNGRIGEGARSWTWPSAYLLYTNISGVYKPAPVQLFVFLDEHEDSINDGVFHSDPDNVYTMVDYPAARHGSAGAFAFADGHAEIHAWKDGRTMPGVIQFQTLPLNVTIPADPDLVWIRDHATARSR